MKLFFLFCYSLLILIANQIFFPTTLLMPFVPLLVIACFSLPKKRLLLLSFALGFFLDCTNYELPFGFFTTLYCLVTLIISIYRIYFSDFLLSLFLFLFIFSYALCLCHNTALIILGKLPFHPLHSLGWDLILSSILDACAGLVLFFIPSFLSQSLKKWMRRFLFFKKNTKTIKTSTNRNIL